jgi:hypothetical protein
LPEWTAVEKMAVLAAVVSHHGGWSLEGIGVLDPRWFGACDPQWFGASGVPAPLIGPPLPSERDNLTRNMMPSESRFLRWWPLASYLMRTLRLSDWRATEDGTRG